MSSGGYIVRYREIIEALSTAEQMAKEQERRRKANADLDAARKKRTDALRKQQDTTRAANEKERQAKLALSNIN
jgi:hypothetical protein